MGEDYLNLAKLRAGRVREFMEQNPGYYRHLSFLRPQRLRYEADDEDIQNLAFYYPSEIIDYMPSEQLARHPLVKEYENFVEHIETTEKYKEREPNFSNLKLNRLGVTGSSSDSGSVAKNFLLIWRRKCVLLKRLLFRQFWRFANVNRDFGPAEVRFVAFIPRDKKSSRTNTFRKDFEVKTKLEELRRDNELALSLIGLVLRREELKLLRLQVDWLGQEKPARLAGLRLTAEGCLGRVKALTEAVAAKHRLELPAEKPPPQAPAQSESRAELPRAGEPPSTRVDNDLASFVCSLAAAMHEYQLFFSDVQKSKFALINRKIRYSKNAKCNVVVERRMALLTKREAPPLTAQRVRLDKRVLRRTGECFLTKTDEEGETESSLREVTLNRLLREGLSRASSLSQLLGFTERVEGPRSLVQAGLLAESGAVLEPLGEVLDSPPNTQHPASNEAKATEEALQRMSFEDRYQAFVRRKSLLN